MALDPQVQRVLELVERAALPAYWQLDPEAARAQHEAKFPVLDVRPVPLFRVEDAVAPGPPRDVPVRIYTPRPAETPMPVLLWLHGGGHVVGSIACYDGLCRTLSARADCIVVSVGYRLAPEHPFPAAVDDAWHALRWAGARAADFGGDPERIAIGGDSAGGNLAAVCALLARDAGAPRMVHQFLAYPATAPRPDSPSQLARAEGYLLDRPTILWFHGHYVANEADREDFRLAPLLAPDLSGLAPAHVIVAEYDPLHDEGVEYARRMEAAGTPVALECYDGMVHGFISMSAAVDAGARAVDAAVAGLRAAFGAAPE